MYVVRLIEEEEYKEKDGKGKMRRKRAKEREREILRSKQDPIRLSSREDRHEVARTDTKLAHHFSVLGLLS